MTTAQPNTAHLQEKWFGIASRGSKKPYSTAFKAFGLPDTGLNSRSYPLFTRPQLMTFLELLKTYGDTFEIPAHIPEKGEFRIHTNDNSSMMFANVNGLYKQVIDFHFDGEDDIELIELSHEQITLTSFFTSPVKK
ncbi:hypothetical protein [Pseudoalteromonas sp. Of11M-6]|uniref:hypothetical protein n=1 Tax=Pseudoalteromonas sp. Of11M-6 TaxID=2917754 RepID=UPI001EF44B19|nr:hypothetical protein [Pseudoalteromonas sp. Of11M-6]MCG7556338.1 hypothetical protein [Pseudoalteromonas sp. Of11M-6]